MSNEDKIGLIPAAGKGLRLGLPYPKELYPIIRDNRYKPVAQFVLENLVIAGIKHVVFVVNDTKHQLMGYFGSGKRFQCQISYVVQEPLDHNGNSTSPGLAHALDAAYHLIQGKTVFFGMADTIMEPADVFSRTLQNAQVEDDVVLSLFDTRRPQKFGMVESHSSGRVVKIVDKPPRTALTQMWGAIVWRPRFTEFLHEQLGGDTGDFARILNRAIATGMQVRGVHMNGGSYLDLGTYEEIKELDLVLRDQKLITESLNE